MHFVCDTDVNDRYTGPDARARAHAPPLDVDEALHGLDFDFALDDRANATISGVASPTSTSSLDTPCLPWRIGSRVPRYVVGMPFACSADVIDRYTGVGALAHALVLGRRRRPDAHVDPLSLASPSVCPHPWR